MKLPKESYKSEIRVRDSRGLPGTTIRNRFRATFDGNAAMSIYSEVLKLTADCVLTANSIKLFCKRSGGWVEVKPSWNLICDSLSENQELQRELAQFKPRRTRRK